MGCFLFHSRFLSCGVKVKFVRHLLLDAGCMIRLLPITRIHVPLVVMFAFPSMHVPRSCVHFPLLPMTRKLFRLSGKARLLECISGLIT